MSGVLKLTEGVNFRDIGGLPVSGGHIRKGRIFRSGRLNRLTVSDRQHVETLGIVLLCDLRGPAEQADEPYAWLPQRVRVMESGDSSNGDVTKLTDMLDRNATAEDGRRVMIDLYRRLAESHADRYASAFRALAKGETPAILACTAGKDRTGMAIAILMGLIGASRATMIENYALSDKLHDFMGMFQREAEAAERDGRKECRYLHMVQSISPQALAAVIASDPDYLVAGLSTVEAKYGSVQGYAQRRLGMTDEEIAALRRHLVM